MPRILTSADERDLCGPPEGGEEQTPAPSTFLNVDFENYLVHHSQQSSISTKHSSSSSTTGGSHWYNQQRDRENLTLENQVTSRPRSTSLTDNVELFRTRRNLVAGLAARSPVRHIMSSSDCHVCGVCAQLASNYACSKDRILDPVKSYAIDKVSVFLSTDSNWN